MCPNSEFLGQKKYMRLITNMRLQARCACNEKIWYLICESKVQCCKVPYGVSNAFIVWIFLKALYSPVLASFAYSKLLDFSPSDTQFSIHVCTASFTRTLILYGTCMCVSAHTHNRCQCHEIFCPYFVLRIIHQK
jgi:hypothetical protein